jgi:Zn-dependent protease with chaperone function
MPKNEIAMIFAAALALALFALAGCAAQTGGGQGDESNKPGWMPTLSNLPNVPFLMPKGEKTTLIAGLNTGPYTASTLAIGEEKDLAQRRAENLGFVRTAAVEQYLGTVRAELLAASGVADVPGRVMILANPAFSAYSTPDGNVYIAMGWLKHLDSADEVAALLAHELAHVLLTHHSSDIIAEMQHKGQALHEIAIGAKTQLSKSKTVTKSDARGLTQAQLVADATDKLVLPAWNRQQEREADLLGVDLLIRANYSPAAMVSMLEKLKAWEELHREPEEAFWEQVRQTAQTNVGQALNLAYQRALTVISVSHPKTDERINEAAQYLDRHYGDVRLPEPRIAPWKSVTSRPDVADMIKNYETAFRARQYLDALKLQDAYLHARAAAAAPTAADAYPNWVLARAAASLNRQPEAVSALQRAVASPEPVAQIYEDLIAVYERGGNVNTALSWTDRAWTVFAGAPRWRPVKIRLLRKAGRTADADAQTVDCSLNAPDWRRLCQEANLTTAGGQATPASSLAPKPTPTPATPAVTPRPRTPTPPAPSRSR